jgi:vacuolar-type H+-ATPase subunit E/Vma4
MEELQSTEALDREILEDARRKAFRVLKAAEDTVKTNALSWEKKTKKALDGLERRFEERRLKSAEEIMARLPLDKRRAESEMIERLVRKALRAWYGAQSRERVLGLLEASLRRRLEDCPELLRPEKGDEERHIKALFHKLSGEEGRAILEKLLPPESWEPAAYSLSAGGAAGASSTGAGAAIRASGALSGEFPELVLDSAGVRISASLNSLVASLFDDYRLELTAALIGDGRGILAGGLR